MKTENRSDIVPVIIAGGSGTRLWPLSRKSNPKQFLKLLSKKSLFQEAVERVEGLPCRELVIVCGEEHKFLVTDQLKEVCKSEFKILLEPESRNTAPALAAAAHYCEASDTLLVLAADHLMTDTDGFLSSCKKAALLAKEGKIVTFGVSPTRPHDGYGYIVPGKNVGHGYLVERFVEKPTKSIAEELIQNNSALWNSGNFAFKSKEFIAALDQHAPLISTAAKSAIDGARVDGAFIRLDKKEFLKSPKVSVDYAVMEKASNVVCVNLNSGWSDLGSWDSIAEHMHQEDQSRPGQKKAILENSRNTFIHSSSSQTVVSLGMKDTFIINTEDALLVASKEALQQVKHVVSELEDSTPELVETGRKVYRPWGWYDSVDQGENFKVKRICVNPGETLSLQKHSHRAEHWVVVKGTAEVTRGTEVLELKENQSIYIPLGEIHRLANRSSSDLQIIEVQTGSYLEEDDIIRLEDVYSRN